VVTIVSWTLAHLRLHYLRASLTRAACAQQTNPKVFRASSSKMQLDERAIHSHNGAKKSHLRIDGGYRCGQLCFFS
jgi:hypothetical protein